MKVRLEFSNMEVDPGFSTTILTRYSETDQGGRIYHSNYFVWLDIARTAFFDSLGISYAELEEQGLYIVIKKVECEYLYPARYNQLLTIKINKVQLSNVKLEFSYLVTHENSKVAIAYTKLAFINDKGTLLKIPQILRDKLEAIN